MSEVLIFSAHKSNAVPIHFRKKSGYVCSIPIESVFGLFG